jgi:predicted MFS family arabinose efflux permease
MSPNPNGAPDTSVAQPPDEGRLTRQIVLLSLAAFASAVSARISDPLLPQLSLSFAISTGEAAHAVSAFALAYGLLQLCYGPLGDHYGKYRIITFATLASLAGALGSALAASFQWLVAARLLSGATAAALIPLSMAWIADKVPYERRQHVLAYFLTGQILGVIGGQMIGGIFADLTGWRGAFWCQLGIYLVIGSLLARELHGTPTIDHHPDAGQLRPGFVAQLRSILADGWSRLILASVCAEGALLFGALAFIPAHLHQRYGISLSLAGTAIGMFGIGGLGYTLFAKPFVQTLGEKRLAAGGGLFLGIAFLLLLWADHWLWVLPAGSCAGFGYYMMHNTLQINATQMAPQARGTAVSLFASCFFFGQSLGVGFASLVIDRYGVAAVFASSALLLPLIGLFFARQLGHRHSRPEGYARNM